MNIVHLNPGEKKYLEDIGLEVKTIAHEQMQNVVYMVCRPDVDLLCQRIVKLGKIVDMLSKKKKRHA
jgi:hypothetical protein